MSLLSERSSGTPSNFGSMDDRFLEVVCPDESVPTSGPSKIDSNPSSLISKAGFVLALLSPRMIFYHVKLIPV